MNNYSTNKQPVYLSNGRLIGYVEGDTFHKTARASKHMLRHPKGWASDIDILEQVESYGAKLFEIKDTETGIRYVASIQDFFEYGQAFNRKHGEQLVLPIGYFYIERPGEPPQLPTLPPQPKPAAPAGAQIALPF